ncbi:hypothetical protein PAPYR_9201 [Paratrimastix pyriformis]|uniref:Uncharacterized protein n=1 Tax=Paratrimastix pyriformis TaxID=342808 RepID=A0ABQ8U8Z6_9EUKA|nr:hypothetical protein PAPYR_9201 [Paratrimastix pyriformis]
MSPPHPHHHADSRRAVPTIRLSQPAPGSELLLSLPCRIAWATQGTVHTVSITLRQADGQWTAPLATRTPNLGTWNWTLDPSWAWPTLPGWYIMVVAAADDDTVCDQSGPLHIASAVITPPVLASTTVWRTATVGMSWSWSGYIPATRLLLLPPVGEPILLAVVATRASFIWQVGPAVPPGTGYRILAESDKDPTVNATSQPFEIQTDAIQLIPFPPPANLFPPPSPCAVPSIEVTRPRADSSFLLTTDCTVMWTTTGVISAFNLSLWDADGTFITALVDQLATSRGWWTWKLSSQLAPGQYRVRVQSALDAAASGLSPVFTVQSARISFLTVTDNPCWRGASTTIAWSSDGWMPTVRVTLYPPGASPILMFEGHNGGGLWWHVPLDLPAQGGYTLKVESLVDPTVNATSGPFGISVPSIQVTTPRAGDEILMGATPVPIGWTIPNKAAVESMNISLWGADNVTRVANLTTWLDNNRKADNSWSWNIAGWHTPGRYFVQVASAIDGDVAGRSGVFAIRSGHLYPPSGLDDSILRGTPITIRWNWAGSVPTVRLLLQAPWAPAPIAIAPDMQNVGRYQWDVGMDLTPGSNYRLTVLSCSDPTVSAASDPFAIDAPSIAVAAAPSLLIVGQPLTVTWSMTRGPIPRAVTLDLILRGAPVWSLAGPSTLGAPGRWDGSVPGYLAGSAEYAVRVTGVDDPLVTATSQPIEILTGQVALTEPGTQAVWFANSTQHLAWTAQGNVTTVTLRLVLPGQHPAVSLPIASGVSAALGQWDWAPVPLVPITDPASSTPAFGASARVEITSDRDPLVSGQSELFAYRLPTLTFTAPTGADVWVVGRPHQIKWTTVGPIPWIMVDLYAGGTWVQSLTGDQAVANEGSLWWPPSVSLSLDLPYRLDIRTPFVGQQAPRPLAAASSEPFALSSGSLVVTDPMAGSNWTTCHPAYVTWTVEGHGIQTVRADLYLEATLVLPLGTFPAAQGTTGVELPGSLLPPGGGYSVHLTAVEVSGVSTRSPPFRIADGCGLPAATIALIAVGSTLLVILLLLFAICCCCVRWGRRLARVGMGPRPSHFAVNNDNDAQERAALLQGAVPPLPPAYIPQPQGNGGL